MIDQLEQAIIDRLKQVAQNNNIRVSVDSHGGQLSSAFVTEAAQKAPAVWMVFDGMEKLRKLGREGDEYEARFTALVASSSVNRVAARQGGRNGLILGAYQLIRFVIATLNGFSPVQASRPLETTEVKNLFSDRSDPDIARENLAIYSTAVSCRFVWAREADPSIEDLELIFHASTPDLDIPDQDGTTAMETNLPQKEDVTS